MDNWEKEQVVALVRECVKYGNFTLHSGQKSNWICDLLEARGHFKFLYATLRVNYPPVGIELGGMLLASGGGFIRKDGSYYPTIYHPGKVSLIDDVVTTEGSMKEASLALEKQGVLVGEYLGILDRREPGKKVLEIRSLVTADDLGLEIWG